ncbi:hypothetical protein trd_A0189 (plasmid) [Thermomicrobium roseum DSM 5159]|uniref:Uncharacterized protein n=1 Tax=Thermomicrobium roseum (strain ATCC 27502 / DSM 5159 / P-2) TaxID=309801 RepID=B9L325_THERP|nr:hypothetical protein trd_A0189 [Thermomicrobium roseum DSM 5159]
MISLRFRSSAFRKAMPNRHSPEAQAGEREKDYHVRSIVQAGADERVAFGRVRDQHCARIAVCQPVLRAQHPHAGARADGGAASPSRAAK